MLRLLIGFIGLSVLAWGCDAKEEVTEAVVYDGPLIEVDSTEILYSDSAIVKVRVQAAKQFEYENGNREFPEGIYVEYFEADGSISSTLKADKGYYFKEGDRYTGVGNVVVRGMKDNTRLDTDTLHWSPPTQRVYTKAPVLITDPQDTLRGRGLEAKQDFTSYTILNPIGSSLLDEENPEDAEPQADEE